MIRLSCRIGFEPSQALASQHHLEVDRHAIGFAEPVKVLGAHRAKVRLHRDVEATLKLEVVARAETAG